MVYCKELKKEFNDHPEMLKAIKANKQFIVDARKSAAKLSDPVLYHIKVTEATKAMGGEGTELKIGDDIFAVINTTNWFDSHGDVHLDGIWDVSAKDQNGKVYYIINHELELGKVIGYPEDVEVMVVAMSWKDLGIEAEGMTQALIFKVKLTEKGNSEANKAIMAKVALQNSVRMQYVDMMLCINDTSEYYKEEYANWIKYYSVVANKDDVTRAGYFWAIREAKIYKEGSAVLFGSNSSTPILDSIEGKTNGPAGTQPENEKGPSADSLDKIRKQIIYSNL